jgi:GAF domain-containing protein
VLSARTAASPDGRWRALLGRVCERCVGELDADHASIGVATGPSQLTPGAATSESAASLEDFAFTVGEGPCFDAMREHVPVVVGDVTTDDSLARWPAWSGAAADHHIRAATALPIEAGAITAGVLSVYARSAWHPDGRQLAVARRLVDLALLVLLDMALSVTGPGDPDAYPDGRPDELAVLLRADVHRAAGMVMAQAGVSIDQALARLRAHAFAVGRPLPDVAADVLARRLRFDTETDSAQ